MIVNALGREWSWPEQDEKCREVVFEWAKDLEIAYKHCRQFRTCVQAGGNMGVWPYLLSKKFEKVYTFEADPRLYSHLEENLKGCRNVNINHGGLWSEHGQCHIKDEKPNNLGAQFVVPDEDGAVPLWPLDDFELKDVDLIYLDIEGAEWAALQGAYETISKWRPTIVVEDKGLSEKFGTKKGDIERWLYKEFGYVVSARPHRDVVMVCASR
jgi:FkbM family methyltransferase